MREAVRWCRSRMTVGVRSWAQRLACCFCARQDLWRHTIFSAARKARAVPLGYATILIRYIARLQGWHVPNANINTEVFAGRVQLMIVAPPRIV